MEMGRLTTNSILCPGCGATDQWTLFFHDVRMNRPPNARSALGADCACGYRISFWLTHGLDRYTDPESIDYLQTKRPGLKPRGEA